MVAQYPKRSNRSPVRYESDFVAWAERQAALLDQAQLEHLDLPNLMEMELSA